jgi:2-polyprenyl-3-methyl-5-hydroxy-6-metoxy-1,4-benzoquinol methylase
VDDQSGDTKQPGTHAVGGRTDERAPLDPGEAWNNAAPAWDVFVETGADYLRTELHGPALLSLCEPVAGLRVLDVGCGQGWFARQLAERGARVVGIDIAPNQVANARRHEAERPLGIVYHELDAVLVGERWQSATFDLVTACMVLQDLPDAAAVLNGAHQVLVPGGRIAFSIPHPVTDGPFREWERDESGRPGVLKIDRYFDSGFRVVHWNMARLTAHWDAPVWHRTLSEWSALIAGTGFIIRQLVEPRPTQEQVEEIPKLEPARRLPYFLLFKLESV